MNWIDLVLILVVVLSVFTGWRKGFILATLDLATWVGSVLAGFVFYKEVASLFETYWPSLGVWTFPLSFLVTIFIARLILSLLARSFLNITSEGAHKNPANRLMGIVPGAINGGINATILAAILLALPISDQLSKTARESKIPNKLAYQVEWLEGRLSPIFDEAINRTVNNLSIFNLHIAYFLYQLP